MHALYPVYLSLVVKNTDENALYHIKIKVLSELDVDWTVEA
jgi:hypothetical protein